MRRLGALCLAFALAACAADEPLDAPRITARLADAEARQLVVFIEEIPRDGAVQEVILRGPGGQALAGTPSGDLVGDRSSGWRPAVGVGATGGSSSGIDPFFSLDWTIFGLGPKRRPARPASFTVALPEGLPYPARIEGWWIEVRYLDPRGVPRRLTIPAPG